MVRKNYARPEIEVVKLNQNDLIATSGGTGGSTEGGGWGARSLEDIEDADFLGDFE